MKTKKPTRTSRSAPESPSCADAAKPNSARSLDDIERNEDVSDSANVLAYLRSMQYLSGCSRDDNDEYDDGQRVIQLIAQRLCLWGVKTIDLSPQQMAAVLQYMSFSEPIEDLKKGWWNYLDEDDASVTCGFIMVIDILRDNLLKLAAAQKVRS